MQGCAGGHGERLGVSPDGRVFYKETTLGEVHFYLWLQRLANPIPVVAAATTATAAAATAGDAAAFRGCPLGCSDGCPLLQLRMTQREEGGFRHRERHGSEARGRERGGDRGLERDTWTARQLLQWMPCVLRVERREEKGVGCKTAAKLYLENVVFGLEQPVVIDIKMGRNQQT